MPDLQVQKWKQVGNIFLWRYKDNFSNYPGWNITATPSGISSMLKLVDLMIGAKYSSKQALKTLPPTEQILKVPNNHHATARWSSISQLQINHPKNKVDAKHWSLQRNENSLTLTLGFDMLTKLKQGFIDIQNGEGDYGLGDQEDEILYFWWYRS